MPTPSFIAHTVPRPTISYTRAMETGNVAAITAWSKYLSSSTTEEQQSTYREYQDYSTRKAEVEEQLAENKKKTQYKSQYEQDLVNRLEEDAEYRKGVSEEYIKAQEEREANDNPDDRKGEQTSPEKYSPGPVVNLRRGAKIKDGSWLEEYLDTHAFALADNVLITVGEPRKKDNPDGSLGSVLGLCQTISVSTNNQVHTFKELRAERNIIITGKAQPGSIQVARIMAKGSKTTTNFMRYAILANSKTTDRNISWSLDNQLRSNKREFGMGFVFMDNFAKKELGSFYLENCNIANSHFNIQAGAINLVENIQILFNRILDCPVISINADS